MSHKLIVSTAMVVAMMMSSCHKDNGMDPSSGNGQSSMTYQMRAINTSGTVKNQRTTANGVLHWTSGYAVPRQIKFEAKKKDLKIEYTSTNTDKVDLFAPAPTDFGSLMLPPGTYKEIELKLKLEGDGPDAALYLEGTYTNNGVVLPVIFRIDEDVQLKTELKDVTIDSTGTVAAITNLDLASYLDGVTDVMIQNAQLTNGTLVISRTSNKVMYNTILQNIAGKRHKCEYKKHK